MGVAMRGKSTGRTTVELVHESGAVIKTTAPKDNVGDGSGFSPTDLCAASLGACGTTIMSMFAADKGIPLDGIEFGLVKEMSPPPRKLARMEAARFRSPMPLSRPRPGGRLRPYPRPRPSAPRSARGRRARR